ncbi:MAG: DUF2132 domain-containing protein [Spirochaetales bacterium]|nr:MAG: DUF2132 domain-containing protein [Spirochaetales bacterium]
MAETSPKDPLHGITLQVMVEQLQEKLGWEGLARKIPANCFVNEPSIKSSLTFLRRTPWAREKLEKLYLWTFHRGFVHQKSRDARKTDAPAPHAGDHAPGGEGPRGTGEKHRR